MKKLIKKSTSWALVLTTLASLFFSNVITASAAPELGVDTEVTPVFPPGYCRMSNPANSNSDEDYFYRSNSGGWEADPYVIDAGVSSGNHTIAKLKVRANGETYETYCLERGVTIGPGHGLNKSNDFETESAISSPNYIWRNLSPTQQQLISKIMLFATSGKTYGVRSDDVHAAAQCLIWEVTEGKRTSSTGLATSNNNPTSAGCSPYHAFIVNGGKAYTAAPDKAPAGPNGEAPAYWAYWGILQDIVQGDLSISNVMIGGQLLGTTSSNGPTFTIPESGTLTLSYSGTQKAIDLVVPNGVSYIIDINAGTITFTCKDTLSLNNARCMGRGDRLTSSAVLIVSDKVNGQNADKLKRSQTQLYCTPADDPYSKFFQLQKAPKVVNGDLHIRKTVNGGSGTFTFSISGPSGFSGGTFTLTNGATKDFTSVPVGNYTITETGVNNTEWQVSIDGVVTASASKTVTVPVGSDVTVNFTNTKRTGEIDVYKSNAAPNRGDYNLANAEFEIYAGTHTSKPGGGTAKPNAFTNSSGLAKWTDLNWGAYTVFEKNAPNGYVLNTNYWQVDLTGSASQTSIVKNVGVPEQPQVGRITVEKVSTIPPNTRNYENLDPTLYSKAGAVYGIYASTAITKYSGGVIYAKDELVDTVTTTMQSGKAVATSKDLPLGSYYLKELNAPAGHVLNTGTVPATLSYGGQTISTVFTSVTATDLIQVAQLKLTKLDAETNTRAQGDSTLNGGVFGFYDKDKNLLEIMTMPSGSNTITTAYKYPLGNYFWKEITPPTGYTLNTEWHSVTFSYRGQTVSEYVESKDTMNTVIKGQIELYKIMEGDPGNETSLNGENGAQFQVWLKSAGGYNAALPTERDYITTKANPDNGLNGWAKTKMLPYGVYVVHQIAPDGTGPSGGTNPIPDFEVFIDQNLKVYPFYKWNGPTIAFIQMAKRDSETGQIIPLANTAFKLWSYAKNDWYSVRTAYPSPIVHDTFYTDSSGTFTMPEPLNYGRYRWVEVSAPFGYVNPLAVDPSYTGIDFAIDENMQVVDGSYMIKDNIPVFLMSHSDQPQKARIGVDKFGDQFSELSTIMSDYGMVHTPIFERQRLAGCQFVIRAKTDIVTPDGTKRYSAGQTVDTLITSNTSTIYSKLLYLGEYEVVEVSAANGFIKEDATRDVQLVYRGEMTVSFDVADTYENERGQVQLNLQKLMAKLPGSDAIPFDKVKYGLYADQDFADYLGNICIHKGDLMEVITLDRNGMYNSEKAMLWGGYVLKELETHALYELDSTEYKLNILPDNPTTPVKVINITKANGELLTNDLKKGKISIEKTGIQFITADISGTEHGNLYAPVFEERPLEGAEFDIVAKTDIFTADGTKVVSAGEIVGHLITVIDGKAESDLLFLAEYYLIETKAPFGYVLDNEKYNITLNETNLHDNIVWVQVGMSNKRQKVLIDLQKQMELPTGWPEDFNPYSDVEFGVFSAKDIINADGEVVIPADSLVGYFGVDNNGKGILETDLPFSDFYILELKTNPAYQLNTERFDFSAEYPGEEVSVILVTINDGEPIVNDLIRGTIKVFKIDEDTKVPLEGVVFEVIDKNGNVIAEITTDADGIASLIVKYGDYIIKEKTEKEGYILNETEHEIEIREHEKVYELEVQNRKIQGQIRVYKYDGTSLEPLQGVVFGIYNSENELVQEIVSDAEGFAKTNTLRYGEYTIVELRALPKYKLDTTPFNMNITENNKVYDLRFKNEKLPDNPNIPKTGNNSSPIPWIVLAGALGAIALSTISKRRIAHMNAFKKLNCK